MGPNYLLVGSTPDSADPAVRFEVCLVNSRRSGEQTTIYLTKYDGRTVGERSVGLRPDMADNIAEMLRTAVSMWREQHVDAQDGSTNAN